MRTYEIIAERLSRKSNQALRSWAEQHLGRRIGSDAAVVSYVVWNYRYDLFGETADSYRVIQTFIDDHDLGFAQLTHELTS